MPSTANFEYTTTEYQTRVGSLGEESVIEATRIIRRKPVAPGYTDFINLVIDEELMITEEVLPIRDKVFEDTPPAGMSWQQFARYRGHTLTYAEDRKSVIARMRWTTMAVTDPTSTETMLYMLPAQVEYVARTRMSKIYRTAWTVDPPPSSDASADIGGVAMAGGFQGTDFPVGQVAIRMRFLQDASSISMLTAASTLTSYMGKSNQDVFLGCAIGSLICEGVSVAKTGQGMEYYEVIFEFLYDRWNHHEQVPTFAEDGNPKMNASVGPAEVKWKRLPRTALNFGPIFGTPTVNAQLKKVTETGWWE
jgi:hypothetical protein